MRAIFVNHCHPDCPHVCGTRAREFANALARDGHRIVLLTETLRREDPAIPAGDLRAALRAHDWTRPFRLACRPTPAPALEALRAGRLPAAVRGVVIAYQYLGRGGMFTDWRAGSQAYWRVLADAFEPEIVWGIFGNTDAWAIAQGIARQAGCAWVRDIKDQWTQFIPGLFRSSLAARFTDAAATTALSQVNATDAAPWVPAPATVVYSGFPETLLARAEVPPSDPFTLVLVGAVYNATSLALLVEGLRRFVEGKDRGPTRIVYAGTDTDKVTAALRPLAGRAVLDIRGQIPFTDYATLISRAHANLYVRTSASGWWHHKIVELLAVGRPIVCCPAEIVEARRLADSVGGTLYEGSDASVIAASLDKIWGNRAAPTAIDVERLRSLTWDTQAQKLLAVLSTAMTHGR